VKSDVGTVRCRDGAAVDDVAGERGDKSDEEAAASRCDRAIVGNPAGAGIAEHGDLAEENAEVARRDGTTIADPAGERATGTSADLDAEG
jgi:hypothetical protein